MNKLFLTGFSIIFGFFLAVPVQAAGLEDVQFPIAELGNCADQSACETYCNDSANSSACLDFGQNHGLIEKAEAEKYKSVLADAPGGCRAENECRTYCETEANFGECVAFAEKHQLLPKEEISAAKDIVRGSGPGGCKGANECRTYCEDSAHQEECIDFGHRKGLISDRDAEVSRRVIKEGGPGGCKSEAECRAYCEDVAHAEECVKFAEDNGFISKDEAVQLKKVIGKTGPGGCKGEACRTYCDDESHQEECLNFAEENDLMSKEEVAVARKFIGKTGPGGCKGEACRTHCDDPANGEECLKFAEENGLIPKEEAERARKFMQVAKDGGPGGCQGRQCQEYCSSEEHQEECFSFAKKNGLVSKEEQEDFEVGQRLNQKLKEAGGPGGCKTDEECRVYCSDSAHVEECVAFAASQGGISEERAREMLKMFTEKRFEGGPGGGPSPEDLKRFQMDSEKRFDQFRQFEQQYRGGEGLPGQGDFPGGGMTGGQFPGGGMTGGNFPGGPGGCQSPAECMKYCSEHMDECMKFGQGGGEDASDFGGSDNQGSYQENDGFSGCITKGTKAVYVCAIGGKDAPSDVETTYFNGCHAESNGARVLHAGLCDGHTLKCSDIADPVCGTDNSTYTSACVAKDHGAEVQYEGACKFSNTRQPQPSRKPGPQPAQRQPYSDGGQMPQGKPEQYQQDQYPQGGCDEACQQKYREQYQQQGAQPSAGSTPSCSSGMFWDAGQKKCVSGSAQQGDSNQQNQQPSSTCDEACQQKYREQYQDSYQQPPEGQQYQSDGGQYQQGSYPTQQ